MLKWFHNRSLIHKIAWMITLILVIPTLLIGIFYYQSYKRSLLTEADHALEGDLNRIVIELEKNQDTAQNVMDEIAYNQEFLYFLDGKSRVSENEAARFLESIQKEWINIRYAYPNMFDRMVIYSSNPQTEDYSNGKLFFSSMDLFEEQLEEGSGNICYGKLRKPRAMVRSEESSGLQIVEDAGLVLPVFLKVRNVSTDEVIGIVELDVPLEKLIDAGNLPESIQEEQFLLLDGDGNIVYQTGTFQKEDVTILQTVRANQVSTATLGGADCRLLIRENESSRMRCVLLIEEGIAVQAAQDMIWKVGIVALLGILCILGMTYLLMRQMLKRLVEMDEVMGKVETGDFNVLLDKDGYGDEISRMKQRFNQMTGKLESVISQMIEKENAQKDAELRALQAQINPHFLYNTLETMRMQCEYDRYYKISESLLALGDMFRYTMKWRGYEVPFEQEWKNLENYISIMALRLDDDLEYELHCTEEAKGIRVPKMLLQPVVENSFQHGFKGVAAPWKLKVTAEKREHLLEIVIEDNGCGIPEEKLLQMQEYIREKRPFPGGEEHSSIGIRNVIQRMDMVCHSGSELKMENRTEGGLRIVISIVTEEKHVSDIGSG